MIPLDQLSAQSKSPSRKKSGYDKYDKRGEKADDPLRGPRIPPQDLESEKALLGSLLLSSDALFEISDIVTSESFYAAKHQIIFEAIDILVNKKEPVDVLTVSALLRERKEFDQIGGAPYLGELLGLVGSAANVKYYAHIVRKKELLRRLIEASTHISEISYDESEPLETILEDAERRVYEITTKGSSSQRLIAFQEMIEETWERIEKLSENTGELRGVPSGFKALDNKLSGFQKSDLIILAARPSVGKTSLALDFARHAAVKHNIPVAIFSLEMSKEQLVDRMLSAQSQVDSWKLRTGLNKHALDEEFARLNQGMHELMKAPIYVDDKAANSILNMRSVLRRLSTDKPIGLIIVDYLQLMSTAKNYDNMVNQVTEISRSLKALAKEFNAPVIALSQLSRAVEARGGKPRLSDLRDSGSIEQDADIVMFIHREKDEAGDKKNMVEILIEKHRNGPTGMVELYFDDKKTSFVSVEKSEFGDFVLPSMNIPDF